MTQCLRSAVMRFVSLKIKDNKLSTWWYLKLNLLVSWREVICVNLMIDVNSQWVMLKVIVQPVHFILELGELSITHISIIHQWRWVSNWFYVIFHNTRATMLQSVSVRQLKSFFRILPTPCNSCLEFLINVKRDIHRIDW